MGKADHPVLNPDWGHFWKGGAVPKNVESSRGNHVHDEGDESGRQLKEFKRLLNIMPFQSIISFFKIQFQCNISRLTPPRDESPNHLLDDDDVIARMLARHKPSLTRVNHLCHVRFEPLNNDMRHQFVKCVAETNGAKLGD